MPAKPTLDKLCWQWAETTEPEHVTAEHMRTAYRLNLPVCKLAACKRQCKGNPYCMNCIGEKIWFSKIDDSSWHDIQDPAEERRVAGMFVGLKNLGATCYVNTFLQLWFQNDTIRKGVYEWREAGKEESVDWEPDSVCGHLQVIFGLLELSNRRYIDPSKFIKHLGLDAGQQQDAQEFSNLFLSVLEQNLQEDVSFSMNGRSSSNVIKEQFCGTYAYVTRCTNCSTASERLSEFNELDLNIQGHKTLAESLKGFLQVEKLEGDNQYMCNHCDAKHNATRAIELKSLPPVLNLQLLRFVFDIKTGLKKKLNSCIQFPDVLDMRDYLPEDNCAVYDLSAVLIHRGASAYSGHYVAHIKGRDSQAWYKFNDEEVEKIKGRQLQLGSEEELDTKKQKSTRTPKGHHSSKNAYMLVYTKRKDVQSGTISSLNTDLIAENNVSTSKSASSLRDGSSIDSLMSRSEGTLCSLDSLSTSESDQSVLSDGRLPWSDASSEDYTKVPEVVKLVESASILLPQNVLRYIASDNDEFEAWIVEMYNMMEETIAKGQEKQETVKAIYQDLAYIKEDDDKYEWIPMSWFSKWFFDPSTAPPIDVSKLLCSHNKACPEKCLRMKCVSQRGSDQLFSIYGGEKRLQGHDSLCEICVKNKCNLIRTKKRIAEDDKFISAVMKTKVPSEKCYLVGKGSFRSWRRLAVEILDEHEVNERRKKPACEIMSDDDLEAPDTDNDREEPRVESSCSKQEDNAVSPEDSSETEISKVSQSDSETHNNIHSPISKVSNVDNDDSLQFNEDLLCEEHGGLDPETIHRKMVPESVWVRLKRYFPNCKEFAADCDSCEKCSATIEAENESRHMNKQLAAVQKACLIDLFHDRKRPAAVVPGHAVYIVSSEFVESWRKFVRDPLKCDPVTSLMNEVLLCQHAGLLYPPIESETLKSDAKVTYLSMHEWQRVKNFFETDSEIKLYCQVENESKEIMTLPAVCDECLQLRLNDEEGEMFDYERGVIYVRKLLKVDNKMPEPSTQSNDNINEEPEFSNDKSKKRNSVEGTPVCEPPQEKYMKGKNGSRVVRKSQRHRKARGEKEVTISSRNTLKDLKVEIMRLFSVPPFDQNLYINGRLLDDNSQSLTDLRVASGSVVELVADEPQEDTCFLEDTSKESGLPESGFKGTNLLSASSM